MIDIETEVFDRVATAIYAEYPDTTVSSMLTSAPASFPAVSLIESSNTEATDRSDSSMRENASDVAYYCSVYSDRRNGAKGQAKRIAQIVDEAMRSMNFARTYYERVENPAKTSVYQINIRFSAVVGRDGTIYRR